MEGLYQWVVLLHVIAAFTFALAHGVSAGVALKLRAVGRDSGRRIIDSERTDKSKVDSVLTPSPGNAANRKPELKAVHFGESLKIRTYEPGLALESASPPCRRERSVDEERMQAHTAST